MGSGSTVGVGGGNSIAGGSNTNVSGFDSIAYGLGLNIVAIADSQAVFGKYNQADSLGYQEQTLFIIGCGTSDDNRRNAASIGCNTATREGWLKIGNTKITESQLIALLNLLS
jgi:hypothetical protein